MPSILLYLYLSLPGFWALDSLSCPSGSHSCLAFITPNPTTLSCPAKDSTWFFQPLFHSFPRKKLVIPEASGDLHLLHTSTERSGTYICQDEAGNTRAVYNVDFQDGAKLYLSHSELEQQPLKNQTVGNSSQWTLFTQWGPWQACDRCGIQGERKRVGLCYARRLEQPELPCGLADLSPQELQRGPELQIESCFVPCGPNGPESTVVLYGTYNLEDNSTVWLSCPFATIYRPVSWEAKDISPTWLQQLSPNNSGPILDLPSGGSRLRVTTSGTYRCYVSRKLVGRFDAAWTHNTPVAHSRSELIRIYSVIEAVMVMAVLLLILLSFIQMCRTKLSSNV
ncbi:protein FAM187B [Sarcophilus harrisii]|uniref:Family with sequence similarity 187 member B n=1 Tax=Sarcophilus harrisii TaxID=9305 RepID=G3VIT2_SARHA|nr:protein FAM187B [Sarcophilus harrisii]